jgi:hypothetical protein
LRLTFAHPQAGNAQALGGQEAATISRRFNRVRVFSFFIAFIFSLFYRFFLGLVRLCFFRFIAFSFCFGFYCFWLDYFFALLLFFFFMAGFYRSFAFIALSFWLFIVFGLGSGWFLAVCLRPKRRLPM